MKKNMFKRLFLLALTLLFLNGCTEEAQPYEEHNTTISTPQEKGHIDTH